MMRGMKTLDLTLYGIAHCDTVRKARTWLTAQGVEHRFHDFQKAGVPGDALARWLQAAGNATLVNRRGTTWRQLDAAAQAAAGDDATAAAVLQAHSSAIKRPVAEWRLGGGEPIVTVGFDPADWAERIAKARLA